MNYKMIVLVLRAPVDQIDATLLADYFMYSYQDKWKEYQVEGDFPMVDPGPVSTEGCEALLSPFGWEENPTQARVDELVARNPGIVALVLNCKK